MDRDTEYGLIRRALEGDREAAADLVRGHQASLYAYILRLCGRPEMAEDVVQDAFVRVLTNLDRFDPRFRFSTWLFTIAKRLYVNANQKLKPSYDSDTVGSRRGYGGDWGEPGIRTVDEEVAGNARAALDRALVCLTPEQREVVVLFYQLDWPVAQIAEYLGMPEGTVKSHLYRGRKRLRAALESDVKDAASIEEVWG